MRLCCMCHEWKPETDFAFRSIKSGARQSHCRRCHAVYRRRHYLNNRDAYVRREAGRIKKYRIENRSLMREYLRSHTCVDCGETDIVLLEFDNVDPTSKVGNIGELVALKPWRLVLKEIEKCVVRCVACHRKRTAEQFHWRAAKPVSPIVPDERPAAVESAASSNVRTCT